MPVRNQNWYNLQSTRRYPLDDKSTGVDDAGEIMRDDIIVDCHIRFPRTLGNYVYVQGITVSDNLVTIVIGAAVSLMAENNPTIAVVSLTKPAGININYAITALQPGVSGWVVFGQGIESKFVGRYSSASQTYIGLRNARPYDALPIPTIGKLGLAAALSGLVRMAATPPVTAEYVDEHSLPEDQRKLKYDPQTDETNVEPIRAILFSTEAPNAGFNPLTVFLGQCGQRPESGTCLKKPIERINGVEPDCVDGNINIVGDNGLTIRPFEECGGIDITTPRGLTEACQQDPKSEKQRKDDCCEGEDALAEYCWPPFEQDQCVTDDGPIPTLPICLSFSACNIELFNIVSGTFSTTTAEAPQIDCCAGETIPESTHDVYVSNGGGPVNIALLGGAASDWAYNHTISVDVQPRPGGSQQNGGVVINYMRVKENGRCRTKYVAAIVDMRAEELQIYRFNGSVLIKESSISVAVYPNHWYKISITATPGTGTTTISAALYNITAAAAVTTLSTNITDYEAVNGRMGVFTRSSPAYFNKFEVVAV